MPLIKFCKAAHNIRRAGTLQIGSLYWYRGIENKEIRDASEGKFEFSIDFPEEIELDRRWANLLFHPLVGFGDTADAPRFAGSISAHAERMHLVRQTRDSVIVKETRVKIERTVNNCLMFCMSLFEGAHHNPFVDYEDHWT